jgi:thiol-disulfide isomerase/thioredoxin
MTYRKHSQLPSQAPQPVATMMSQVAQPGDEETPVFVVSTPQEFASLLDNFKLIVVDVWQDNCAPCDALAPKFHDLAEMVCEEHGDDVAFATVNARAGVIQVESTPMVLVYSHQNPNPIAQYSAVEGFNQFTSNEFFPMMRKHRIV